MTIFIVYMICSCLLLSTTFIQICIYTQPVADGFIALVKSSLTFFQIARLQCILSTKQTIYGYRCSLFLLLYTMGIVWLIIIFILIGFLVYPIPHDEHQCLSFQFQGISN